MTAPSMAGWNLGLRFGLELAALAGFGVAAWKLSLLSRRVKVTPSASIVLMYSAFFSFHSSR